MVAAMSKQLIEEINLAIEWERSLDAPAEVAIGALRKAAARIKELEAERKVTDHLNRVIFDQVKVTDRLDRVIFDQELLAQRDAIEAATIERCIDALKNLTGRTRGPIIEEAIGVIRALIKPTEVTSAPAVPLSTST